MGLKTNISKLHYDKGAKGLTFNLLKFCSYFYAIGSGLKNYLYDSDKLEPKKVDAYVVSVGNLTTGGVGKTPVVAEIAKYYIEKGEKVAIVSRGYGSKLSNKQINVISDGKNIFFKADLAGDEPHWLAENTKAVVITSKNRYEASKYAVEKFGVTKIILDDGFQHRKLHRDLDIVLIDSEKGFGNENLLPAGPLREGLEAFNRIDKLVIVSKNTDHTRADKYAKIMGKKLKKDTVVCYTEPDCLYNIFDKDEHVGWDYHPTDIGNGVVGWACQSNNDQQILAFSEVGRDCYPDGNEHLIAFSAIGQPQQFYAFLKDLNVVKTVDFDDHHAYVQKDIDELLASGVKTFITTEKDAGKLLNLDFKDAKVFALKLKTKLNVDKLLN